MAETHLKPWYKRWWGIIIAIFIWPFFLWWYIWAKSGKKVAVKIGATVGVWVACVMSLIAFAAALPAAPQTPSAISQTHTVSVKKPAPKPKTTTATSKKAVTQTTATPTSNSSKQTPTESIATLNAQAVTLFNPVLADLDQQMAQGQADAAQSDAGNISSAFHAWETAEQDKQNVTNNYEVTNAYNKADNAYYNAHQTAPSALDNWDTDAGSLPGDISGWASAEQTVAGDNVMGSPSSSDQQAASSALQQYKNDLAKARADVAQL